MNCEDRSGFANLLWQRALETKRIARQAAAMAKSHPPSNRQALIARLSGYWKMEAGNVVFVPGIMLFLAGGKIGILSIIAMAPMMALLAIGAIYWRAKLHHIEHGASPDQTIERIAALDRPMLVASALAIACAIVAWTIEGLALGLADRWVATASATLAALEYVNYYHRQLQHFDHLSDWKRLISGGGFRKSQLRQDIERLRGD
ncbi:hypothetical protein [Erythrobacter ani]|uniref:Uncharacterized protein n=1 Tax=Erythrobacter ani TaxID=2827235 RepID=A0ABS6SJX5_9SPHN|nr:hypothetical protein [Erythrobacter ani]MBV7265290.1 hypothetical protein [Erythrobacter ani]